MDAQGMFAELLEKVVRHEDLTEDLRRPGAMRAVMEGRAPAASLAALVS